MNSIMGTEPAKFKTLHVVILFVCAFAFMPSVYFIKPLFEGARYYGLMINAPAPAFQLVNLEGKQVRLSDLKGQYVYLMFGYLNCKKTCHSQALILDDISNKITDSDVHFIYISMDPERDDTSRLLSYFNNKNQKLSVLKGEDIRYIQSIANGFKVPFSVKPLSSGDDYEISHPGYITMINPLGYLSLVYSGSFIDSDRVLKDLQQYKFNFQQG